MMVVALRPVTRLPGGGQEPTSLPGTSEDKICVKTENGPPGKDGTYYTRLCLQICALQISHACMWLISKGNELLKAEFILIIWGVFALRQLMFL